MGHEEHEIGARLVLDDHASHALEHVKEGFEHVKEHVHEVGHELVEMAKQAAAVAIGFQLEGMIESTKEFGEEVIEGARHLANQKQELAGLIALTGDGEESFDELANKAGELNEKLETLAITNGATKDSLVDAFEMIASRSKRSTEEVSDMVGKMSEAARVLPGGMETMAAGWRDLEQGFVKPKNALVTLMRQTHVVEGSAKQVAKALTAMIQAGQQEKVFKLGEEAVTRMAARAAKMPLTFDQLLASAKNIREMFFETAGTPIIGALGPELEKLRQFLIENREEIEHLAKTIGVHVGEWVKEAAEIFERAFRYLEEHADDIAKGIEDGAHALKEAVAFVVQHKELLMGLFVAYKGGGAMGAVAGALPGIGTAAGKLVGGIGAAAGIGEGVAGVGAAAASLAVLAVPLAAVGAAAYMTSQAAERANLDMATFTSIAFTKGGEAAYEAGAQLQNFNVLVKKFQSTMKDGDQDAEEAVKNLEYFNDAMQKAGQAAVDAGTMTQDAFDELMARAGRQTVDYASALEQFQSAAGDAAGKGLGVEKLYDAYQHLAEGHEKAAEDYARKILMGNTAIVSAMGALSVENAVEMLKKGFNAAGEAGKKLPAVALNFGPSSFTLQQDFRGEDPDRVALIFRRDIARQATSRVGAKTGTPFGV